MQHTSKRRETLVQTFISSCATAAGAEALQTDRVEPTRIWNVEEGPYVVLLLYVCVIETAVTTSFHHHHHLTWDDTMALTSSTIFFFISLFFPLWPCAFISDELSDNSQTIKWFWRCRRFSSSFFVAKKRLEYDDEDDSSTSSSRWPTWKKKAQCLCCGRQHNFCRIVSRNADVTQTLTWHQQQRQFLLLLFLCVTPVLFHHQL